MFMYVYVRKCVCTGVYLLLFFKLLGPDAELECRPECAQQFASLVNSGADCWYVIRLFNIKCVQPLRAVFICLLSGAHTLEF